MLEVEKGRQGRRGGQKEEKQIDKTYMHTYISRTAEAEYNIL